MPTLDWRDASVRQEMSDPPRMDRPGKGASQILRLDVTTGQAGELAHRLEEVLLVDERELRLELADEWIVFWKLREAESRLLAAHPVQGQWVVTNALERPHAEAVIGKLRAAAVGEVFRVGDFGLLGRVSNVDVEIGVCAERSSSSSDSSLSPT